MHADMAMLQGLTRAGQLGCALWFATGCGAERGLLPIVTVALRSSSTVARPTRTREMLLSFGLQWASDADARAGSVWWEDGARGSEAPVRQGGLPCTLPAVCAWERDALERALLDPHTPLTGGGS